MKDLATKYLTIILIIASSIAVGKNFSWEGIAALITSIIAFVSLDIKQKDTNQHDRALFNDFLKALPSDGSIKFIEEWNAAWDFPRKKLYELQEFDEKWTTPEHKFLDKNLEEILNKLHKLTHDYLSFVGENTFVNKGNTDYACVPAQWEEEQPETFKEVVKTLHASAKEIVSLHRQLVTLGIKKGLKKYQV